MLKKELAIRNIKFNVLLKATQPLKCATGGQVSTKARGYRNIIQSIVWIED